MSLTISARRLISAGNTVDFPVMIVEDGHLREIKSLSEQDHQRFPATYCFPDATLCPAYLDIHIHGCAGHDVMEATPEAMNAIGSFLGSRGVGAYLPTTVTSTEEETFRSLSGLARQIERLRGSQPVGATPLGIHLEGPFLSHTKRGVHQASLLKAPSVKLFDRLVEAAEGHILLMTIAPELPGSLELIAHARAMGIRCSMGHSDGSAAEADAGFRAGARSATHTFNAMRAIDHRDPGLAAYVLDQSELFAEIICDGIHVDPMMVRLYLKAKRRDRLLLVTDGISATGMPNGRYMLGEMEVDVFDGRCTSGGTLAGSVLTLEKAVQNFMRITGASLETTVDAASRNPSHLLGVSEAWGSLEPGQAANITVLSPAAEVVQTFLCGRPMSD